jgi:hypothetical protein
MLKYGKTPHLEDIVYSVKKSTEFNSFNGETTNITYPKIMFEGTVKVHGTNAGVVIYKDKVVFQSREREITIGSDNHNFAAFAHTIDWQEVVDKLKESGITFEDHIAIYGEWAGGNIQKGVAVTGLPTFFMIFEIVVDGKPVDGIYYNIEKRIYHAAQFGVYTVEIDFNTPAVAQNKIAQMVKEVEDKCPVGSYFGKDGIGEGIVFKSIWSDVPLKFKAKGPKHTESKTKTILEVDVTTLTSEQEFVEEYCVESRLSKGIDYLKEMNKPIDISSTGDFIKWVVNDIITEKGYVMTENMFNIGRVKGIISTQAKNFFFNYLKQT